MAAVSSATHNAGVTTLEAYANERGIHLGWLLYLRGEPGFPRPVRHGRFDREALERFLSQMPARHWVAKC